MLTKDDNMDHCLSSDLRSYLRQARFAGVHADALLGWLLWNLSSIVSLLHNVVCRLVDAFLVLESRGIGLNPTRTSLLAASSSNELEDISHWSWGA
jgi:hypothetical protein